MSDKIKISIPLGGRGMFRSVLGRYLQRRGWPQYEVNIFPNTHYCSRLVSKANELGWGTKKMAQEQGMKFPRTR